MDYSQPDASAHGISQVRIMEWVAISFSRPRAQAHIFCVSYIDRQILYHWGTKEAMWIARNPQSIDMHLNHFLIQAAVWKGPLTLLWPKEIWDTLTSKAIQTVSFNCLLMPLHRHFLRLSLKRLKRSFFDYGSCALMDICINHSSVLHSSRIIDS